MKARLGAGRTVRVLLVLGALLVVVAGQRAWSWRSQVDDRKQAEAAVSAASAEVTRLISVSAKNSEDDFAELLDGATAGFQDDLRAQATRLQKALVANKVDASGAVVSAGVGRSTGEQATVFVAATGTVSNSGTSTGPESRDYRVKVELRKIDDRWLVSGLEFIA